MKSQNLPIFTMISEGMHCPLVYTLWLLSSLRSHIFMNLRWILIKLCILLYLLNDQSSSKAYSFIWMNRKKSKKCDIGEKVVGTLNIPVRASLSQEHHLHPVLIRFKFILQTLSFISLSPLFLSGLPQWWEVKTEEQPNFVTASFLVCVYTLLV